MLGPWMYRELPLGETRMSRGSRLERANYMGGTQIAMFGLGPIELLVVAVICLLMFGVPIALVVLLVVYLNRQNRPRD